jgi:DNA polymerase
MSEFDELEQQINTCTLCSLSNGRNRAVPGNGSRTADIMFIGEGPGYYEDQQGLPFVGNAGNVLNQLLASIGLKREDVYVTNMVKCRPPQNRDPQPDEIKACQTYLDKQIEMIDPKVIVTLGRFSFGKFFPGESISKARGKPRRWKNLMVFPVYHPAAVLHNPKLRTALEDDFRKMPQLIEQVMSQPVPPQEELEEEKPQTQQLSLF